MIDNVRVRDALPLSVYQSVTLCSLQSRNGTPSQSLSPSLGSKLQTGGKGPQSGWKLRCGVELESDMKDAQQRRSNGSMCQRRF